VEQAQRLGVTRARLAFAMELATVVNQGILIPVFDSKNTPDNDLVVATLIKVLGSTLKTHRVCRENRYAVEPLVTFDACKLIELFSSKTIRQFPLPDRQDINGEMFSIHEYVIAVSVVGNAPEYKRRVYRNRIEAAHCHACPLAVGVERSHDRNPGRKTPQCAPKISGTYLWILITQSNVLPRHQNIQAIP
jgi:hypothetical protein